MCNNPLHDNFSIEEKVSTVYIIPPHWHDRGSWKTFLVLDKKLLILHCQYHGCWCPGDATGWGKVSCITIMANTEYTIYLIFIRSIQPCVIIRLENNSLYHKLAPGRALDNIRPRLCALPHVLWYDNMVCGMRWESVRARIWYHLSRS